MGLKRPLIGLMILLVFAFSACDWLEDEVNDATAQSKTFSEDMSEIPLMQVKGFCSPVPMSFDTILSEVPIWDDVKGHIKEIEVDELYYSVSDNENAVDGTIDIYITDSNDYFSDEDDLPPEGDRIGSTAVIKTGNDYEDRELEYSADGKKTLEDLMMDFEQEFYMCVGWSGGADEVDMTFTMGFEVTVTFVPIGD